MANRHTREANPGDPPIARVLLRGDDERAIHELLRMDLLQRKPQPRKMPCRYGLTAAGEAAIGIGWTE